MLLLTIVAAMGAMARVYLGERRTGPGCGLDLAGGLLDRARGRHSDQGAVDPDVRRADDCDLAVADRSCAGCWGCGRSPASSGSRCWCCPGSSPSSAVPAMFFAESVGQDL